LVALPFAGSGRITRYPDIGLEFLDWAMLKPTSHKATFAQLHPRQGPDSGKIRRRRGAVTSFFKIFDSPLQHTHQTLTADPSDAAHRFAIPRV
jgi:hypothetical protein